MLCEEYRSLISLIIIIIIIIIIIYWQHFMFH
jgi:hypothetical protein